MNDSNASASPGPAAAALDADVLRPRIVQAIKTVFDPEIPVDVYELGLVYGIDIAPDGNVAITMTLTSPNCPSAEQIPVDVDKKARTVEGVKDVKVTVTFDPPWDKDKMSEAAKLELGIE